MLSWDAGNGNAQLRANCKQYIRNRDHSVHRLSAVGALNFHRKRSTCVLLTSVGCERSWNPISTSIAKMQGDSGETQFTFDGNAAAPAEGISQSSPGTADSGDKSTRTTKSGWQKMTSRHRRASTTSTPRSARDVARSGNARRGTDHRGGHLPNIGPRGQSRTNLVGSRVTLVPKEDQPKHVVAVNQ